ncbi:hypothetical protein GALL_106930 [mine drainage metagenome]|uniref:Phage integrase central domain-containing protein n=1 Tax=mine drainage metagenome TaxID=410659 RepID=A0A1J5SSW1_9ZZZZ
MRARKWTEGHLGQNRQSLRDYFLPKIGARPIASLTAQDVMRVLEPLEAAGKLETLRRVRQRIGSVLSDRPAHRQPNPRHPRRVRGADARTLRQHRTERAAHS